MDCFETGSCCQWLASTYIGGIISNTNDKALLAANTATNSQVGFDSIQHDGWVDESQLHAIRGIYVSEFKMSHRKH